MRLRSFLAVALTAVLFTLSGCQAQTVILPTLPDFVTAAQAKQDQEKDLPAIALYYDNTRSMYGFVQPDQEAPKGQKRNFIDVTDSIYDLMAKYQNPIFYTLSQKESYEKLTWNPVEQENFRAGYKEKDFFAYDNIGFSGTNGPLQLLFSENSPFNENAVNIIFTDFSEQDSQQNILARELNDLAEKKEDFSIALFAVKSYFYGTATVPDPATLKENGSVDTIRQDKYRGVRPYYCVMAGPTQELLHFADSLKSSLTTNGLKEGTDFYYAAFLSHYGLQSIPFDQMLPTDTVTFAKGLTTETANQTANVDTALTEDVFSGITQNYSCFTYTLQKSNRLPDRNTARINLLLPLQSLADGSDPTGATYSVDTEHIEVYTASKALEESVDAKTQKPIKQLVYSWSALEPFRWQKVIASSTAPLKAGTIVNNADTSEFPQFVPQEAYAVEKDSLRLTLDLTDLKAIEGDYISLHIPVIAQREPQNLIPDWVATLSTNEREECFEKTLRLANVMDILSGSYGEVTTKNAYAQARVKTVADVCINIRLK